VELGGAVGLPCAWLGGAATHRGQALLGVVAGSAHRVDDRGWLRGGLGTVYLGFG